MKKLKLDDLGVQEMNNQELLKVEGGAGLDGLSWLLTNVLNGIGSTANGLVAMLSKLLGPAVFIGIGPFKPL